MTDRIKGLWVALDEDMRLDDAQSLIDAIGLMRGVAAVEGIVASPEDWVNRKRIRRELEQKVLHALRHDP